MRFDYWTVRVTPHPMGITSIGVGVIVVNPINGETRYQFRDDDKRIFSEYDLSHAIHSALRQLKSELRHHTDSSEPLGLDGALTLRGYLSIATSHWVNLIRVDEVQTMDAASIDHAAERLFALLIGGVPRSQRSQTVRGIRSAVQRAYRGLPLLSKATVDPKSVTVGTRDVDLNLAVINNGEALELNQAFNFQAGDAGITRRSIDVWTLKIEKLRSAGGILKTDDLPDIKLSDDVAVTAVCNTPEGLSQQNVFSEFRMFCAEARIELISDIETERHARKLEELLAG